MATITEPASERPESTPLPPRIDATLAALRRRIRGYIWMEGLSIALVWAAGAFWSVLAIDWLFEPVWPIRLMLTAVAAIGLATILYRLILRRAFVQLTRANMAMLLERRFGEFNERLLTAVELESRAADSPYGAEMLRHATIEASDLAGRIPVGRALNVRPLALKTVAAVAAVASIVLFSMLAPEATAFYIERLGGSDELWPRDTLLAVEPFSVDFAVIVERDDENEPSIEAHVYRGSLSATDGAAETRIIAQGEAIRAAVVSPAEGLSKLPSPRISPCELHSVDQIVPGQAKLGGFTAAQERDARSYVRRTVGGTLLENGESRPVGSQIGGGALEVSGGTVELSLQNGVTITAEPGARFRLPSTRRLSIRSGRLSVVAPTRSAQLRVEIEDSPIALTAIRNDTIKTVRGSDVDVIARASALKTIPQLVELRYRTDGGGAGREIMQQQSTAIAGRDEFQEYRYSFKNVLSSIQFDVTGGDDRVRGLRIEAVDSPRLLETSAECVFPKYLVDEASGRFTPRTIKIDGPVELPQGTHVALRMTANRSIAALRIDRSDRETPDLVELPRERSDRSQFEYELGKLAAHTTLLITLLDDDRLANRQPIPLHFSAKPDEAPDVQTRLFGVGVAATSDARFYLDGTVSDDYGLDRGWFSLSVDEQSPSEHPLASLLRGKQQAEFAPPKRAEEGKLAEAIDLKQLRIESNLALRPGQRIQIALHVADGCRLADAPNVGRADRYLLDVVTPEELLGMLEARELLLRQKFETIIDELEQTRDSLAAPSLLDQALEKPEAAKTATFGGAGVIVERALQNSQRAAYETTALAEAFDAIRYELIANRVDTSERIERLQLQIAEPLRLIAKNGFPRLEERVMTLRRRTSAAVKLANEREALSQLPESEAARRERIAAGIAKIEQELQNQAPSADSAAECRRQADVILTDMQAVLAKMIELEDYNKLVDMLRELIDRQDELNKRTKRKQLEDLGF